MFHHHVAALPAPILESCADVVYVLVGNKTDLTDRGIDDRLEKFQKTGRPYRNMETMQMGERRYTPLMRMGNYFESLSSRAQASPDNIMRPPLITASSQHVDPVCFFSGPVLE